MIAAAVALLKGLPGRVTACLALAVALLAAGTYALHRHDELVIAGVQAAQARAVAAAAAEDTKRVDAAVDAIQAAAAARIASMAAIRRTVDASPQTSGCAAAPAMRAALDGLRQRAGGSGSAAPAHP